MKRPKTETKLEHDIRKEAESLNDNSAIKNKIGWSCSINSDEDFDEIIHHIKKLYKKSKFHYFNWEASKIIQNKKIKCPKITKGNVKNYLESEWKKGHLVYSSDVLEYFNILASKGSKLFKILEEIQNEKTD